MGPGLSGVPRWTDNVARMEEFTKAHPEVSITTPRENGTDDFIAVWPGGEVRDRSLGWLMDRVEALFR